MKHHTLFSVDFAYEQSLARSPHQHDISKNTDDLVDAALHGDAQKVAALISVSDPKVNCSEALRWAVQNGHTECVKLLIPVSDPKARHSEALWTAALHGYAECVKMLIPVSDPKAEDSRALRVAARVGRHNIVDLLWDESDLQAALACLWRDFADEQDHWIYVQHKWDAQTQRQQLSEALNTTTSALSANNTVKKARKF